MERLTKRIGNLQGACPTSYDNHMVSLSDIVNLLAAYEDTDLTPDEIVKLNDFEHSQLAKLLAENGKLKKASVKIQNTIADLQKKLKPGDMVSRDLVIEILQGCVSRQEKRDEID